MSNNKKISLKRIMPTEKKCNASLLKRDGYCENRGVIPGARCKHHNGLTALDDEVRDIFKGAITVEQMAKFDALVRDTQSMEGEIAIQKTELINDLKSARKYEALYQELLESIIPPVTPIDSGNPEDIVRFRLEQNAWEEATKEKNRQIKYVGDAYEKVTKRIQSMLDQITKAVERNNKVMHGTKYTISIQQLTEVLHIQLNILENHCKGCPKLMGIAREFQDMKLKGVGSIDDMARLMGKVPDRVKREIKRKMKEDEKENEIEMAEVIEEINDEDEFVEDAEVAEDNSENEIILE